MNRKPVRKIGAKGRRNKKINVDLKTEAQRLGLPLMCELRISPKCTLTIYLTWAHSLRRDRWQDEIDERTACIACTECHTFAQNKGNEENERIILAAIERRETNLVEGA